MDIDVKNALLKAERACGKEGSRTLIEDVYAFISFISTDGADERFDLFRKIYAKEEAGDLNIENESEYSLPKSLVIAENVEGGRVADIVDFFSVLGKSYVFGKYDRRSVDKEKYMYCIGMMNKYIINRTEKIKEQIKKGKTNNKSNSDFSVATKSLAKEETVEEVKTVAEGSDQEPEKTLEELRQELDDLIGLEGVKKEVDQIINLIKYQKKAEEFGEKRQAMSLHLVFYGNPGTGKTTVARLLGKIYKALGVLSLGQLIEVDRSRLVAGYVGQTAEKTQKMIDEAMGGILFIDEAYTLTHGKGENDFGQEAVDTILKAMEDHRDDFIVIVAGYPDLMKEFVSSNPGLKSRFNQYINFEDYTPEQLREIFYLYCNKNGFRLGDGCGEYLLCFFTELYDNRAEEYANGRDVRNYFEHVQRMLANRVSAKIDSITREELKTIELIDLKLAKEEKSGME